MFTGIIEALTPITRIRKSQSKTFATLSRPKSFHDLKLGSSIACNGICLTVTELEDSAFTIEIMHETLQKSNASCWQTGELINLERALSANGRLDGHIVQGHVDRTLKLSSLSKKGETLYLSFAYPTEDAALLVPQGSLALNGVSLTLASLSNDSFQVALIGHTLENTNLIKLTTGALVNVEYDILGKYINRNLNSATAKLTKEWLYEQGF
ncbi:MAG: riboflavin synthase [Candidatus Cloacimonetes bacterium]|nr:riboflavin synthase [Candidatus Cloacimonadota bacterium]